MIRQPDIPALIEYLVNNTDVNNLVGDRIYRGKPKKIPDGVFVTLSMRKEYQKPMNTKPVIRLRVIGHDDAVTINKLYEVRSAITNALVKTDKAKSISTWYNFSKTATCFTTRIDSNRPMLEFWLNWYLVDKV